MMRFLVTPILLVSLTVSAQSMDGFKDRFSIKKDESGAVQSVHMLKFTSGFSLKPYISMIKKGLKAEIARMQQKGYDSELDEFIFALEEQSLSADNEYPGYVRDALVNLPDAQVDERFEQVMQQDVLQKFEFELKDALKMLDLSIIADPTDARYFYRRTVTYEVVKRALNFAKKRFSNVPVLNLASYIIVKVHDLVLEQRIFNQNALLHYLDKFRASQLGMTAQEINRVRSSIYESRISAINFRESNKAAQNWERYGADLFFTMVRTSNTRVRRAQIEFERINFGFIKMQSDEGAVIYNTLNSKHQFSSQMPVAFYYNKTDKVRRFRMLLELSNIALGFLPIPAIIKTNAQNFVDSFYSQQKLSEGSLLAYFESIGNVQMVEALQRQTINPYLF